MKLLDLFSGIGGFSLAGQWAGFETVQFVEIDKFCQKVLRKHWPNVPIHDDIKTFTYKEPVTLLTGGFPCQPFSQAGKKKGNKDDRYLWPEMARIIRECKPNWIIAENVSGILAMAIDNIISDLEAENYSVEIFLLPACAANAPHRRNRVWIVAKLNGERCKIRENNEQFIYMEENEEWYIQKTHEKWREFQPRSWQTFRANEWFNYNAGICRDIHGIPNWMDRIKSLGNSIVPQVVYPIMKCIYEIEKDSE